MMHKHPKYYGLTDFIENAKNHGIGEAFREDVYMTGERMKDRAVNTGVNALILGACVVNSHRIIKSFGKGMKTLYGAL